MIRYWAVQWGGITRIERAKESEQAKRLAFGMAVPEMVVFDLGTRKREVYKKAQSLPKPKPVS